MPPLGGGMEIIMEYIMMEIPCGMFSNEKISQIEVRKNFEYYISQSNDRIDYLYSYIKNTGTNIEFDYSPNSLINLWKWYETQIKVVEKTEEELKSQISQYPDWMKDFVSKEKISENTLKIALDVSFYFAEVIIRNNYKIKWGYFTSPKSRVSVNQPILLGFANDIDLNPRTIVLNCTRKSIRKNDEGILFNMYNTWMLYM